MQLNKLFFKISILFSVALISCGESIENEAKNQTLSEISQFYFKYKSIENDLNEENSLPKQRDQKSKQYFITSNR